jgi:signal transduction histidine kinase
MRVDLRQRPFLLIASIGVACAAAVAAAGRLAERVRFGADDRAAYARVEQEVRSAFEQMASSLGRVALAEAGAAEPVLGQPAEERDLRPLFDRASELVGGDLSEPLAVTVYGVDGTPLAWAGRPAELTGAQRVSLPAIDRLAGPPALFVAPGPLGFRLIRTQPVMGGIARSAPRLGVVAAERLFAEQAAAVSTSPERFSIETSLVAVSIRTRYEGAGEGGNPDSFVVHSPSGEVLVEATVDMAAIARARQNHRGIVSSLVLAVLALTALLLIGPVLDRRALALTSRAHAAATAGLILLVALARTLLALALPPGQIPVLSPGVYHWPLLGVLARHPADFLLTTLAVLAVVGLVASPLDRWRQLFHGHRRAALAGNRPVASLLIQHAAGGAAVALVVISYECFLAETFRLATVNLLQFSPHPWETDRMAIALGLVCLHAAFVWAVVLAVRLSLARWRFSRGDLRVALPLLVAWVIPAAAVWTVAWNWQLSGLPRVEALLIAAAITAGAFFRPRGLAGLRHASQGYRLAVAFFALLLPAFAMYPSLVFFQEGAKRRVVEADFGPEVLDQRENLRRRLDAAQTEIDGREAALEAAVSAPAPTPGTTVRTDSAFLMWQGTALERYRVSSAIELYNASEVLVSRFALSLPEETTGQLWKEEGGDCTWRTFGEISPFGAHERQLLHAGRNICDSDGVRVGTIVIHVILDNSTFSFLSSQNPYMELLRRRSADRREEVRGRDIEFVVYGWSRTALYVSGSNAWSIDDALFSRVHASRRPFWTRLSVGRSDYHVYLENDRSGIYALGYSAIPAIEHFINLAELAALVGVAYLGILLGGFVFRTIGVRRIRSGRALLREIRESFYRKLFLAFVAASVIPVVTLAVVTRVYIADRLRHDVESAAHKTTVIARQMIEDYRVQPRATLGDDAMVGLSRVIGQDVNIFNGARLQATSERDLFASGLLPARTPAGVYRAIVLDRMPTVITEEQAAGFRYMVAAAPLRAADRDSILTVPLTLRQQEIEREIDDLNRRLVLAALLFILVGAAVGYPMAERIADPVNRLTRATRRIALGDFDARVAATSSDELTRLVDAFNRMSAELLHQRQELERTHRLEAWAEMARQVAHDIKNPLTPIQLSAEHLRRVHADRGRPLEPVLEGCVDSILSQVRLLRQIASEFSSFAASPTARLAPVDLPDLLEEVIRPYEAGAGGRWVFDRVIGSPMPRLLIDRGLIGRALTNVIDNALHAMPGGGTVTIAARHVNDRSVELTLDDTGVGMDEEALAHLFEPYFSTKAVGTGLGLSIARRNIELNGGTITVASTRGRGTTVTVTLPVAPDNPGGRPC